MWLLIVTIWTTNPLPIGEMSKGSIHAKFSNHEQCLKAKEKFQNMQIDNYRVVASCTFR